MLLHQARAGQIVDGAKELRDSWRRLSTEPAVVVTLAKMTTGPISLEGVGSGGFGAMPH